LSILGGVEITEGQFQRIADCLPRQRGNVSMTNLQLLNALLYVVEHGCKWRGLPKHFGNWHTIYTRMSRWSKTGVLDRVFARLQEEQILAIRIEHVCLDSTIIKVHPDGTGAPKKTARKLSGAHEVDAPPKFIWLPQMRGAP
jgi:transposase